MTNQNSPASQITGKETQRKTPTDLGRRDRECFEEKGIECKGVRAKARARERWKAVGKPSTPPGTRGSTK